jgi:CDP-6-deoxy-D-xylo-4-hexulose-3-dehydrase
MNIFKITPVNKNLAVRFLEKNKIMTRPIFAGNLARQPVYLENKYRWSTQSVLDDSDYLMHNAFWVGCHPGLTRPMLDYVVENLYKLCITVQGGQIR